MEPLTRRQFVAGAGALAGAVALTSLSGDFAPRILGLPIGSVSGAVRTPAGLALPGARVTLVGAQGALVREVRSNRGGAFDLGGVPPGSYALGASAPGLEYREAAVQVGLTGASKDFVLGPDTHPGAWDVIGNTAPEQFGGTNSGTLLPDGRIFWCHDTIDPVVFDPATGQKSFPLASPSSQGCHMPAVLDTGQLAFFGGGTMPASYANPVKTVKAWDPSTGLWAPFPDLLRARWYPSMVRLADGRYLLAGGGIGSVPPYRTATCEVYDTVLRRSEATGDLTRAGGFDPIILLPSGEVFSGYTPQMYNPASGTWRTLAPMLQPNRGENGAYPVVGSHPDHSILLLEDGRLMAVGVRRTALGSPGSMVEFYDPARDAWSLGPSPSVRRSMSEVAQLPDGKVFCGAGKKEDDSSVPVNAWGQTKVCDLWDPATNAWRRVADMTIQREYHAVTTLVPDGRLVVTGGTGQPGIEGGDDRVEAYRPPYLFRGPRPRIAAVSGKVLLRGMPLSLVVTQTEAITGLALVGMGALSHWMDGGPQRYLPLPFEQRGPVVRTTVPAGAAVVPVGWYMLFALVDGIPSAGTAVQVLNAGA